MSEGTRTAAAVGYEQRIFLQWKATNAQGLRQVYAITETTQQAGALGHDLKRAIDAPWPDISPDPLDLLQRLARTVGVSSYTRFVTRSAYATVDRKGPLYEVVPWKPDGRAGYSGVRGGPRYELSNPSDAELGETVLQALRDSFTFPGRPKIR